jgi:multiple sugar transport system ATP-binding protein
MTAYENLAFALVLRKLPKSDIDRRVRHAADLLEIGPLLDRKPRQMSGGQRQRVALGRAIVREPAVFLFDEPLSNLDAKLRVQMRREIGALHERLGATMVYVTHDQVEAMTLGDRIVVMNEGRVQQVDPPAVLYERPANTFVATFIGSPQMNLIAGTLVAAGDGLAFRASADALEIPLPSSRLPASARAGTEVILGLRPEDVRVADATAASAPPGAVRVHLDLVEPLGHEWLVYASGSGLELAARTPPAALPERGREIAVWGEPDKVHLFDPATGMRMA